MGVVEEVAVKPREGVFEYRLQKQQVELEGRRRLLHKLVNAVDKLGKYWAPLVTVVPAVLVEPAPIAKLVPKRKPVLLDQHLETCAERRRCEAHF